MTEHQRLFLVQARTDFAVFELLRANPTVPMCHALHYLQMATEKLGKAYAWRRGQPATSHRAFRALLRNLSADKQAQSRLGFEDRNENWIHVMRKSAPLAECIEDLAPSLANDGPNPEYPWPRIAPVEAPVEHAFAIWEELNETPAGRQFLHLARRLFAAADEFL
jgi:hypothetical protein